MAPKRNKLPRLEGVVKNADRWRIPVLLGIPTLGTVRFEWSNAIWNLVLPVNWAGATVAVPIPVIAPLRYHVAEAQNLIVKGFLDGNYEWLVLIEDDVVVPPDAMILFMEWMRDGRYPVVSGLYNVKGNPPKPMIFRGRGSGCDMNWKQGEKVWVDGVPTGCLLVHRRLLEVCAAEAPEVTLKRIMHDGVVHEIKVREVFITRREAGVDPETGGYFKRLGTSDLEWCDKILEKGYLKKAGFPSAARKKYPFVVDTRIACGHIDLSTGVLY